MLNVTLSCRPRSSRPLCYVCFGGETSMLLEDCHDSNIKNDGKVAATLMRHTICSYLSPPFGLILANSFFWRAQMAFGTIFWVAVRQPFSALHGSSKGYAPTTVSSVVNPPFFAWALKLSRMSFWISSLPCSSATFWKGIDAFSAAFFSSSALHWNTHTGLSSLSSAWQQTPPPSTSH